jgi:hypothetical protein
LVCGQEIGPWWAPVTWRSSAEDGLHLGLDVFGHQIWHNAPLFKGVKIDEVSHICEIAATKLTSPQVRRSTTGINRAVSLLLQDGATIQAEIVAVNPEALPWETTRFRMSFLPGTRE